MKKLVLGLLFVAAGIFSANAQDVITLRNGDEIKAKVTEITSSEIKYKRFDNLNGPIVVVPKSDVFAINYENGTREVINVVTASTASTVRTTTQSYVLDPKKPYFGIYANPIGFLTFGPMIGAELTIGKLIGEFNLRFPTMGVLMPWMDDWTYGYDCTITKGIGVGVGLKFYNHHPRGGFYLGGLVEFSSYTAQYSDGYGEDSNLALGANIGYKFVFPSKLYLRTGGYIGAYYTTGYFWYPNSGGVSNSSGDMGLFTLLDVAIGINF